MRKGFEEGGGGGGILSLAVKLHRDRGKLRVTDLAFFLRLCFVSLYLQVLMSLWGAMVLVGLGEEALSSASLVMLFWYCLESECWMQGEIGIFITSS